MSWIGRPRSAARSAFSSAAVLTLALVVTTVSCGDDDTTSVMPEVVLSAEELERWEGEAAEVAAAYWGSWPDSGITDRFADDVIFYDPSEDDLIEGEPAVAGMIRGFIAYLAHTEPVVEAIFLGSDSAAYRVSAASGFGPPGVSLPSGHPPTVLFDVFRFRDGEITNYDVWFGDETLELFQFGCFAVDGCPESRAIADRYISAWESRDADEVAALYVDDAIFTDALLGLQAVGPHEIGQLADVRFGTEGTLDIDVVDIYAVTNGPVTATETFPERGRVLGIALHYRVTTDEADTTMFESVAAFEFATRAATSSDRELRGAIVNEEVFHHPDALAALAE